MESLALLVLLAVVICIGGCALRIAFRAANNVRPPAKTAAPVLRPAPTTTAAKRSTRPVPRPVPLAPVPEEIDQTLVADLRALPSTRYRIKGSAYVLSDANRERFGGAEYQMRREPRNRHDALAIAIYGQGHKVGYISAAKAASIAPLLDELPEIAFTVSGAGVATTSIRLWVDVPSLPSLRNYVKSRARSI
jgi:hypothetical protein